MMFAPDGGISVTTSHSGDPPDNRAHSQPGREGPDNSSARVSPDGITELSRNMLSRLSRTIETEIVPRLLVATDSGHRHDDRAAGAQLGERVDEFVGLLLNEDAYVAARYVTALRSQGVRLPAIYLDLLAPAARRLGEMWEHDEATFTDVTLGVCRMHQVLLEFSRCFDAPSASNPNGRTALIVPVPGEQHTFGLFVVIEFLRRAGWTCWSGTPDSIDSLAELVRTQHFDVVGMSVSADRHIETMTASIAVVRKASRNPDPYVIAGGQAFVERNDLGIRVGADAVATDGQDAVRLVRNVGGRFEGDAPA